MIGDSIVIIIGGDRGNGEAVYHDLIVSYHMGCPKNMNPKHYSFIENFCCCLSGDTFELQLWAVG